MRRPDGAGEPVVGHDGEALDLGFGQDGVGDHESNRGGGRRATLHAQAQGLGRDVSRRAETAELGADLAGSGPEMWSLPDERGAHRVDHDDRTDGEPGRCDRAGRSHAPLEGGGGGAVAAAGRAEREGIAACGLRRQPAELPVRRHAAPVLVAAVQEVEGGGLHGDRDIDAADGEAAALLAQQRNRASRCVQAEHRASRKQHGVDPGYRHLRLEQGGVATARSAALSDGGGDIGRIEDDGRHARGDAWVLRMADANAREIGDEILQQRHASLGCMVQPPSRQGGVQSLIPAGAGIDRLSRHARVERRRRRSQRRWWRGWPDRHQAPRRWFAVPRARVRSAAPAHPWQRRTAATAGPRGGPDARLFSLTGPGRAGTTQTLPCPREADGEPAPRLSGAPRRDRGPWAGTHVTRREQ